MRLKDVAVGIFRVMSSDETLLNLLEVPDRSISSIREQIIEDKYPNDLVTDNLTRMCVYETPTSKSVFSASERCYVEIDIYVTKDKNKVDRRVLLIANRLYELFHNKDVDGFQMVYYNRLPNLPTDNQEWVKYGIVFSYDNFII